MGSAKDSFYVGKVLKLHFFPFVFCFTLSARKRTSGIMKCNICISSTMFKAEFNSHKINFGGIRTNFKLWNIDLCAGGGPYLV